LIEVGGLYLNDVRISDRAYKLQESDLRSTAVDGAGRFCILRSGKKDYFIVAVLPESAAATKA
jgi:hypothetical protein